MNGADWFSATIGDRLADPDHGREDRESWVAWHGRRLSCCLQEPAETLRSVLPEAFSGPPADHASLILREHVLGLLRENASKPGMSAAYRLVLQQPNPFLFVIETGRPPRHSNILGAARVHHSARIKSGDEEQPQPMPVAAVPTTGEPAWGGAPVRQATGSSGRRGGRLGPDSSVGLPPPCRSRHFFPPRHGQRAQPCSLLM